MILVFLSFVVFGFLMLRFNSYLDRRLSARRKLHGLVKPLAHYSGLLDHELQNASHHADPLITQAVLDHVTELRSFLIRPESLDLHWGIPAAWVFTINSILIRLEEGLESSLEGAWDDHQEAVTRDIRSLLSEIQFNAGLKKLTESAVGLVEP